MNPSVLLCLAGVTCLALSAGAAPTSVERYGLFEISLKSDPVTGNPFDPDENDVRLVVTDPKGGKLTLPAFYDGENTWRVRFTPVLTGTYRYRAEAAGRARLVGPAPSGSFRAIPSRRPGFVRRAPKQPHRFALDSGRAFYPVGHNVSWTTQGPRGRAQYDRYFQAMGKAGENWARVWMCAWGGLNLEWTPGKLGQYDLDAARYLDHVLAEAERRGIYLQLVLQHHGQFSTRVNPNWAENPYSTANGGFLDAPGGFFTDPRARDLTRRKYRYILARWGYSTHIMAWELWNEVQFTDHPGWEAVDRWHDEMAAYLRSHDPYRHLVTSSSPPPETPIWRSLDYLQEHAYTSNPMVAAGAGMPEGLRKPFFVGEWGGSTTGAGPREGAAEFLRRGLWSGMLGGASGAPMFWYWDYVDQHNLYPVLGAGARFANASGLAERGDLRPLAVPVDSPDRGPLTVSPGVGWGNTTRHQFRITPDMGPTLAGLSSFIQGKAHPEMMPQPPEFQMDAAAPTKVTFEVSQISGAGAEMVVRLDGQEVARRSFEGNSVRGSDPVRLSVEVPAGSHRLTLANEGPDWLNLARITFDDYAPRLRTRALGARDLALVWVYNTQPERGPSSGTLRVSGLRDGRYTLVRYDTSTGAGAAAATVSAKAGRVAAPVKGIAEDAAFALRPTAASTTLRKPPTARSRASAPSTRSSRRPE